MNGGNECLDMGGRGLNPLSRRGSSMNRWALTVWMLLVLMVSPVRSEGPVPSGPSREDKCPVCGMFVAKYPDFVAQVIFKDGAKDFFDGAKDMFKYFWNVARYNPGRSQADISAVFVTDYYELKLIDGMQAFYVVGSNVYGPMGRELIPFEDEDGAREFLVDHGGSKILRFKDVTVDVLKPLD